MRRSFRSAAPGVAALLLHLHLPNGVGKTKLTNDYLDRTLATVATVRNWNTVGKLVEMSS